MAICAMVTPLGVCDGLDRVNDGKVSVKVLALAGLEARKSPCAPSPSANSADMLPI